MPYQDCRILYSIVSVPYILRWYFHRAKMPSKFSTPNWVLYLNWYSILCRVKISRVIPFRLNSNRWKVAFLSEIYNLQISGIETSPYTIRRVGYSSNDAFVWDFLKGKKENELFVCGMKVKNLYSISFLAFRISRLRTNFQFYQSLLPALYNANFLKINFDFLCYVIS